MTAVDLAERELSLNTIHEGDAVSLLNGGPGGWADLIFADPPFNIGYGYDVHKDRKPYEHYVDWTRQWMGACRWALEPTGSFYIAIGDEYAAEVRMIGRELGLDLRNWITWSYTFGQNSRTGYCRSHVHIFYFVVNGKDFTFNDRAIRFPSARHTVYRDKRANPLGRLPDDTWNEFPRVCGTFKERAGWHGCQMPEGLLRRVIQASSNPGDVVLDPFAGSGTTPAVAAKLGRRFVGIDVSPEYVQRGRERVQEALALRSAPPDASDWTAVTGYARLPLGSTCYVVEVRGDTSGQVDRLVKAIEKAWGGLCAVDAARIAEQFDWSKRWTSGNVAVVVFSQHPWPGYVPRPFDWRLETERTIEGLSEEPYRDSVDCAIKQGRMCDMLEHELPSEQWQLLEHGSVVAVSPWLAADAPEQVLEFEIARWLATVFMDRVGVEEAAQGCRHVYRRYSGMGRVVVDRLALRIAGGSPDSGVALHPQFGVLSREYCLQMRDFHAQSGGESEPVEPDEVEDPAGLHCDGADESNDDE